ncbi:orotidine-5'-phosphate decarboxylase [Telmatospirillum sp. J64-1]|uniref:orotidine-5'-phosphate decarboxylase n=1 Tax=Telmatospirillum sp. J64-1 TaxID=2502183 RepID=UPI00115EC5B0|nr:orotidine-5'-phosphate decarboxylase [Telmatospirillum sp. J64-1]
MHSPSSASPVFCALDTTDVSQATGLAQRLAGSIGGIKLGLEFFCANGPSGIEAVAESGLPLFLDLKFHDIPNTVAGAMRSALRLRPFMTTLHACGGTEMMRAACDEAAEAQARQGGSRTLVLAVTVLTSMDQAGLDGTGVTASVADQVRRLAALAQDAGCDGVICSPREAADLRAHCGPDFKLVVPGIRPSWAAANDQKRIMTPAEAMAAGADYLVIGRPITEASDPAVAARRIAEELAEG